MLQTNCVTRPCHIQRFYTVVLSSALGNKRMACTSSFPQHLVSSSEIPESLRLWINQATRHRIPHVKQQIDCRAYCNCRWFIAIVCFLFGLCEWLCDDDVTSVEHQVGWATQVRDARTTPAGVGVSLKFDCLLRLSRPRLCSVSHSVSVWMLTPVGVCHSR